MLSDEPNPECASCPLFGPDQPCSRIMRLWKRGKVRRPEFVRLAATMFLQNLNAHCHTLAPDITEIESRPDMRARKRDTTKEKPTEGLKQVVLEPEKKPVPAIMIGRIPRHRFSLREGK
jgi:hypothetical protein